MISHQPHAVKQQRAGGEEAEENKQLKMLFCARNGRECISLLG